MAVVAFAVVFFAASGFILINVGDKTAQRELTLSQTPAVEAARRALQDAKTARDRECTRVGPVCRDRENAVATRQNELNAAMAKAGTAASVRADPQATALHIDPVTLRLPQTRVLVTMCFVGRAGGSRFDRAERIRQINGPSATNRRASYSGGRSSPG
jgi:hypothetical protein